MTCSWRIPLPLLIAIGVSCGISHGYENGLGVTSEMALRLFYPGVTLAGLLLVAIVAASTVSLQVGWQRIAVRVVGSWIAAIGLLMMGLK